jgi:hypothetical protein
VEAWQVVIGVFVLLLPIVLMLDFWGDERVDARGKPMRRPWPERPDGHIDAKAEHDHQVGAHAH